MNKNPLSHILNITENIKPAMAYDGGDFCQWQQKARQKLTRLLGLPFKKCDDLFSIEYKEKRPEFTEIRFTFQSEEGYFVPCHLLIPDNAKLPLPVVICLQGHTTGMHISMGRAIYRKDEEDVKTGDRDFALGALKKGFCALTLEQRDMGECGSLEGGKTGCRMPSMANLLIGRTTMGERVWDVSRVIDVLEKYFADKADVNNIICMGNSGGGTTTFYVAALDERIKTAMPSCSFASYDKSIASIQHCFCNFVPSIRNYFDMGDLAGLIAPRNLIIVSGEKDKIFPIDSAKKSFETTKFLYEQGGGSCRHVIGNEGHRFYYDLAWQAYDEVKK